MVGELLAQIERHCKTVSETSVKRKAIDLLMLYERTSCGWWFVVDDCEGVRV